MLKFLLISASIFKDECGHFDLREWDGFPVEAIAKRTGLSPEEIKAL